MKTANMPLLDVLEMTMTMNFQMLYSTQMGTKLLRRLM
jgi:hypothetical protein